MSTAWQCEYEPGYFDHYFEFVRDWEGDPNVINGTQDCSFYRCRVCGFETTTPDENEGLAAHPQGDAAAQEQEKGSC